MLLVLFPWEIAMRGVRDGGQGLLPAFLTVVFWIGYLLWKLASGVFDLVVYLALLVISILWSTFVALIPVWPGGAAGAAALNLAEAAPGPPADGQPPRHLARHLVAGGAAMRDDAHAALAHLRRAVSARLEGVRARVPGPSRLGATMAQTVPLPAVSMPWVDVQWGQHDDSAAMATLSSEADEGH